MISLLICQNFRHSRFCQKIAKISSPTGFRIFPFFLEFLVFSHFFKGMNKEKYHSYWHFLREITKYSRGLLTDFNNNNDIVT